MAIGQDPMELLVKFALATDLKAYVTERDWTLATLDELIDDIIDKHHVYVRVQLGRMLALGAGLAPMIAADEAVDLMAQLRMLQQAWCAHMDMEEQSFFPNCQRLEAYQDSMGKRELDDLIDLLKQASHDHHHLDKLSDELIAKLENMSERFRASQLDMTLIDTLYERL